MVMRKSLYRVYGQRKGEKTGTFFNMLSKSRRGAEQQVRRGYKARIIRTSRVRRT